MTQIFNSINDNDLAVRKLLILSLLLCSEPSHATCQKIVTWREEPPYMQQAPDGTVVGIHADLIRQAMIRMNCEVTFVERPWSRSLLQLQAGQVDIVAGVGKSAERENYAWFSQPTNKAKNVVFMGKKAFGRYQLTNLRNVDKTDFRLLVGISADYGGEFSEIVQDKKYAKNLVPYANHTSAWKMLSMERADGFISDYLTGQIEIERLHLENDIVKTNIIVNPGDFDYFALSKKNNSKEFADLLDLELSKMMSDGSYFKILRQYNACEVNVSDKQCSKNKERGR